MIRRRRFHLGLTIVRNIHTWDRLRIEQDIRGLNVAMDNTKLIQMFKTSGSLTEYV